MKHILVIKHGALGDIFRSMGAFQAIRDHHADARIVLLTESKYAQLARQCGYFDDVWLDNRKSWLNMPYVLKIRHLLNGGELGTFDRIYDLQASSRTDKYFRYLLKSPKPEWVGRVTGCSHRRPYQDGEVNYYEGLKLQLGVVGITVPDMPDISWLVGDIQQVAIHHPFICIIPGCSLKMAVKRWTAEGYAALINWLSSQGLQSVMLGAGDDQLIIDDIKQRLDVDVLLLDLCNQSPFAVLASLAREARFVIGSDTGPMHIAAMCCAHSIVLKTRQHDPDGKGLPVGIHVMALSAQDLNQLSAVEVIDFISHRVLQP